MMAARAVVLRLSMVRATAASKPAVTTQTVRMYRERNLYHQGPIRYGDESRQKDRSQAQNPIAASMAESTTPTGNNAGAQEQDAKNAAVWHAYPRRFNGN